MTDSAWFKTADTLCSRFWIAERVLLSDKREQIRLLALGGTEETGFTKTHFGTYTLPNRKMGQGLLDLLCGTELSTALVEASLEVVYDRHIAENRAVLVARAEAETRRRAIEARTGQWVAR